MAVVAPPAALPAAVVRRDDQGGLAAVGAHLGEGDGHLGDGPVVGAQGLDITRVVAAVGLLVGVVEGDRQEARVMRAQVPQAVGERVLVQARALPGRRIGGLRGVQVGVVAAEGIVRGVHDEVPGRALGGQGQLLPRGEQGEVRRREVARRAQVLGQRRQAGTSTAVALAVREPARKNARIGRQADGHGVGEPGLGVEHAPCLQVGVEPGEHGEHAAVAQLGVRAAQQLLPSHAVQRQQHHARALGPRARRRAEEQTEQHTREPMCSHRWPLVRRGVVYGL